MFWLTNIGLFIASATAARNYLRKRFPSSAEKIDGLLPFQSLVGTFIFFIGVFELFELLFKHYHFISRFLSAVLMIGLGYVQGFENIKKIHDSLNLKWDIFTWFNKLNRYQETLGLVGLIVVVIRIFRHFNIFN